MAPFRLYDAAIGRWTKTDAVAEWAPDQTPYRFGFNNPIKYSDPIGLWEQTASGWSTNNANEIADFVQAYKGASETGGDININNVASEGVAFTVWSVGEKGGFSGTLHDRNQVKGPLFSQGDDVFAINQSDDGSWGMSIPEGAGWAGLIYGVFENAQSSSSLLGDIGAKLGIGGNGYWLAQSSKTGKLKYFGLNFKGGSPAAWGSRSKALRSANLFTAAGKLSFGLGVGYSFYSAATGQTSPGKAGLDIVMGGIGVWGGPIGFGVSGVYFIADSYIGWEWIKQSD